MTAPPSPPSLGASWRVRAFAGDTHASLLLPHQMLIAREDALRHGIAHLALVEVAVALSEPLTSSSNASTHTSSGGGVLLECVVDLQTLRTSGERHVQLNAWVLEHLGLREGAAVALKRLATQKDPECQSVELSAVSKYPLTVNYTSSSSSAVIRTADEYGDANAAQVLSSALKCLPESVREGRIDLECALHRQLCASGYVSSHVKLQRGHFVAVQLLQETYVFQVESAIYTDATSESASDWMSTMQVRVPGWHGSTSERLLTAQSQDDGGHKSQATKTTFEDRLWRTGFAGYDMFFQDVLLNIALVLKPPPRALSTSDGHSSIHHQHQKIGSHGLLLSGVHGVGKSLALQVLQREVALSRIPVKRIDGMSLLMESESTRLSSTYEFLAQQVRDAFPNLEFFDSAASSMSAYRSKASAHSSTGVLLIDDIDVLFQTPSGEDASESDAGEALTPLGSSLLRLLDAISDQNARVCIVGTATNADFSIPSTAKRAGRFGKIIEIIVPTEAMRSEILARHLSVLPLSGTVPSSPPQEQSVTAKASLTVREMASRLAALTGGYVAKDLVRICRNSLVQANKAASRENALQTTDISLTWEDLLAAQRLVKPSQLRELNVASPGAAGEESGKQDLGAFAGYAVLRKQLVDFITWKFSPSAAMNRLGVANASGILLHGPSGCGKSLLVRTLAAHARVNFVSVKSSEIMSKYFGDSEKAVRKLFGRARAASPCILFFDEFDAIAHKRSFGGDDSDSGGGDSVYARILSTFLNEMDGVGATQKTASTSSGTGEILVVAATNRVDALDAALIRPGRIDKMIEIGLPSEADKQVRSSSQSQILSSVGQIVDMQLTRYVHCPLRWLQEILGHYTRKMPLGPDVDIVALATRSTGTRPLTGADLAAVCKDAALRALREDMDAETIAMRHFDEAWHTRLSATT